MANVNNMQEYPPTPLRDLDNVSAFNMVRKAMPLDFQRRVPAATKGNLAQNIERINSMYAGRPNEFVDAMVNRIGSIIARDDSIWYNPLAEFKLPGITYGSAIQEYKVGLVEAHNYEHDRESMDKEVWGTELLHVETNYHDITRQEKYKLSMKDDILRRAFLDGETMGSFITSWLNAPVTSDNLDEFLQTCRLFTEYESNGGFYHMKVPKVSDLESNEADAKRALRRVRSLTASLPFMSTKYNAAHMPSHANPNDLVMFCTPEFQAATDVEALAGAFNVEKLETSGRVFPILKEHFGVDHCEGIITTKDFFVIADLLKQNTSLFNPANLQTNYWLHHHQIISASRFVPAIMLSTVYDDEQIVVRMQVTGISAITMHGEDNETVTEAIRGNIVQMAADVQGTAGAENSGIVWTVTGGTDPRTHITKDGVLHIGGLEDSTSVKVTAATAWVDPASPYATPFSSTKTVTVSGEKVPEWPAGHSTVHDTDGDGTPDATDPAPTNPAVK